MVPSGALWQAIQRTPRLETTKTIDNFYIWNDGIRRVLDDYLFGGYGCGLGGTEYPGGNSNGGTPTYAALRRAVDDDLNCLMMQLPDTRWNISREGSTAGSAGEYETQSSYEDEDYGSGDDDKPKFSDNLADGLKHWELGELEQLSDDQKVWILTDRLAISALYTTCSVAIKKQLSSLMDQGELNTSASIYFYLRRTYGPSKSPVALFAYLNSVRRERYISFAHFASAFNYGMRAAKVIGVTADEAFVALYFYTSLGAADKNQPAREAAGRYIEECRREGKAMQLPTLLGRAAEAEMLSQSHAVDSWKRQNWHGGNGWNRTGRARSQR